MIIDARGHYATRRRERDEADIRAGYEAGVGKGISAKLTRVGVVVDPP